VIRKVFKCGSRSPEVKLKTHDFKDEDFQNLHSKEEKELNGIGAKYHLDFTKSGRSITNDSKIETLIEYAIQNQLPQDEVYITPDKDSWKVIEELLPQFTMFPSELNLDVERTEVQSPFQLLVEEAILDNKGTWDNIASKVEERVNREVKMIEENLLKQTDAITKLTPRFQFQWKKMTSLNFDTEDDFGAKVPLQNRGMGVRRLVMVAFLKYMADKSRRKGSPKSMIFGIEEPETYLHPRAQRLLIESLRTLREGGYQIIITSHSPVFAAEARPEDVVLVKRESGRSQVVAGQSLKPEAIVEELGIEPRDLLASYSACIFVEGRGDEIFFSVIAKTLKTSGLIEADFEEKRIGYVMVGGKNLRFFVDQNHMKKINRRFAVVVDSDKKSPTDTMKSELHEWKAQCNEAGGKFYILRRREIENYFHRSAIKRATGKDVLVDQFNDVKHLISSDYRPEHHVKNIVSQMTHNEILEMDKYVDEDGNEKHELVEMIKELLSLVD
jgi:predicted ATP-dependent endonuclease of OLD family